MVVDPLSGQLLSIIHTEQNYPGQVSIVSKDFTAMWKIFYEQM